MKGANIHVYGVPEWLSVRVHDTVYFTGYGAREAYKITGKDVK